MIYISVVSHGHFSVIEELDVLSGLNDDIQLSVVLIDNLGEDGLREWCCQRGIRYQANSSKRGFGANNNTAFSLIERECWPSDTDYFLVLNPDVIITSEQVKEVVASMHEFDAKLSTCNLFKDLNRTKYDPAIRAYPRGSDFLKSFVLGFNPAIIDKCKIHSPSYVDWAAGSFLMFQVSLYRKLGGFDEDYFMYCEDIDICLRSHLIFGERVLYLPEIKVIHWAQHQNRAIFSKHFLWHLRSITTYLVRKRRYLRRASDAIKNLPPVAPACQAKERFSHRDDLNIDCR
jgi:N-acetylglucosaminyl-diphospho-decaprenol L-rhamnosyltransferase